MTAYQIFAFVKKDFIEDFAEVFVRDGGGFGLGVRGSGSRAISSWRRFWGS